MSDRSSGSGISGGMGFGCALAISISWSVNHSIGWAMLHGIFGWGYVIWWACYGSAPWQQ